MSGLLKSTPHIAERDFEHRHDAIERAILGVGNRVEIRVGCRGRHVRPGRGTEQDLNARARYRPRLSVKLATVNAVFDTVSRGPDYLLRWPRDLFVLEAKAILAAAHAAHGKSDWNSEVSLLLSEAFAADTPRNDFEGITEGTIWGSAPSSDPWEDLGTQSRSRQTDLKREFLEDLIAAAPKLTEQHTPRPYYSQRKTAAANPTPAVERDLDSAQRDWRSAVEDLQQRGYLGMVAPDPCVDDNYPGAFPDAILDALIEERIGKKNLWSPRPEAWDEETFFDLVEIFHDLVSRPRRRHFHSFNGCGWHYSAFTPRPAQALYGWSVNRLLARNGIGLRLATDGEDLGRLVHEVDEARADLVEAALATTDPDRRAVTAHAIALFRSRSAGVEDKRSACVALASLLEERRDLLKQELFSTDEGALFLIANKFAIRHRRADQHADYDSAYLDWIFWWFLSTVALIDKLLTSQASDPAISG
ncbi:hypothetical protein GCM10011610_00400 [Nocardia rhizosphaerihabitans]|uniref:Uncharacterized protein n=1 Tax=Nocardia rhizosphaerihabitans TaxID=1691570 RepID=A0ABQ2K4W0_9NOCA|nr:hypothetical protein GCM10011610_00400 [Nocardia rhizosphaerihabitans]